MALDLIWTNFSRTTQVKADRDEIKNASKDIDGLQKQTAQASQDEHEHGKK